MKSIDKVKCIDNSKKIKKCQEIDASQIIDATQKKSSKKDRNFVTVNKEMIRKRCKVTR
jgi:hypothetical protein